MARLQLCEFLQGDNDGDETMLYGIDRQSTVAVHRYPFDVLLLITIFNNFSFTVNCRKIKTRGALMTTKYVIAY